jgi:hypothetical protein
LVADQCWVALASLHREHPERTSFTAREILDRITRQASGALRPGVQVHIYLHNVANLPPNSATYRLFYKLPNGTYRLFRPGDDAHPARKGKVTPELAELPPQYHDLLAWYEQVYSRQAPASRLESDPVLEMLGVGQELWAEESGDEFVARERRGWEDPPAGSVPPADLEERVWGRVKDHEGEIFHTVKNLPFHYQVQGNRLWFFRQGKRVNMQLGRAEVKKAISRCPLEKTTEISDLRDYPYLFALLMDRRIRGEDW